MSDQPPYMPCPVSDDGRHRWNAAFDFGECGLLSIRCYSCRVELHAIDVEDDINAAAAEIKELQNQLDISFSDTRRAIDEIERLRARVAELEREVDACNLALMEDSDT